MNILFDINHPAHVHLFKNAIWILKKSGHKVIVTARDKDITLKLLDNYHIDYISLSKAQKGLFKLGCELLWRQFRLFNILRKNKIQICVSVTGACNVHICKLLKIPTYVFYDTEHATLQNKLTLPWVTRFYTPDFFTKRWGEKHVTYNGVHDLAYLHPKYFSANKDIFNWLNLKDQEPFIIIRFVSWQAAHDIGHKGLGMNLKKEIIELCAQFAKVYIAFEGQVDPELKKYQFPIAPEKMHDAMAAALMYVGEGGSMATEAAVLGTPSIFISTLTAGVFDEYEYNYGLMFSFRPDEEKAILVKIRSLLQEKDLKAIWAQKREKFIQDKIDVSQYMVNEILKLENQGGV